MIQRTLRPLTPADDAGVRIWVIVLLACAAWGWHRWERGAEEVAGAVPETPAAVSAGPAAEPGGTWKRAIGWAGGERAAEAAPDPVVHCHFGGAAVEAGLEDTFVRRSECESLGGRAAEPGWAH